jgi:hypothetical protein
MTKNKTRERRTPSSRPDLSKTPQLRAALKVAMANEGFVARVAEVSACTTHDLKPFALGNANKLPDGLRGRVIAALGELHNV